MWYMLVSSSSGMACQCFACVPSINIYSDIPFPILIVPNFCGTSDNLSCTVLYKVKCCAYATFEIMFSSFCVLLFSTCHSVRCGSISLLLKGESQGEAAGPVRPTSGGCSIVLNPLAQMRYNKESHMLCSPLSRIESSKALDNLLYKWVGEANWIVSLWKANLCAMKTVWCAVLD